MKKYLKLLIVPLVLLTMFFLASCSAKNAKIKFFVDEKVWKEETLTKNDTLKKPDSSTIENKEKFVFDDWYTDNKFTTKFNNWNQPVTTSELNLYAKFNPIDVVVKIKNENNEIKTTLDKLEINLIPQKEDLTVDGFYIDNAFTTKYDNQRDITVFYARYIAVVTFNNLYEDLFVANVEPGETISELSEDKIKSYMDKDSLIYYTQSVFNPFDFKTKIEKNTVIKVMFANNPMEFDTVGGRNYIKGFDFSKSSYDYFKTLPVISIPSIIKQKDADGIKIYNISGVQITNINFLSAKTIIFNEGIEIIDGFSFNTLLTDELICDTVILPESLKIITGSFNGFNKLKNVNLPKNLEVIATSFYSGVLLSKNNILHAKGNTTAKLTIPKSVKYLFDIPCNLAIEKGSKFYQDDDKNIYYNNSDNKKVLAVYNKNLPEESVKVDNSVSYIQAGAFEFVGIKKLELPQNYLGLAKFLNKSEYTNVLLPFHNSIQLIYGFPFLDYDTLSYETMGEIERVFNSLLYFSFKDQIEQIIVHQKIEDVIKNEEVGFYDMENFEYVGRDHLEVYIKLFTTFETPAGENVKIFIKKTNNSDGTSNFSEKIISSGTKLTLTDVTATINDTYEKIVNVVDQDGKEFDYLNTPINKKITLEVITKVIRFGITYGIEQLNGQETGNAIVTGFDQSNAILNSSNTYNICIPDEINGYKVTIIKDNAFAGNKKLGKVIIGKNITKIGNKAFYDCTNVVEVKNLSQNIEFIGTSAFEGTKISTFAINLNALKTLKPYAFKIMTLSSFERLGDNNQELISYATGFTTSHLKNGIGRYFFHGDGIQNHSIVKLVAIKSENPTHAINTDQEYGLRNVHDIQMVAFCPDNGNRNYKAGSTFPLVLKNNVFRVEIMEGSVYFVKHITFAVVSKIHKNAFTSCDIEELVKEDQHNMQYVSDKAEKWVKPSDFNNQKFAEEGFFEGFANGSAEHARIMEAILRMEATGANIF